MAAGSRLRVGWRRARWCGCRRCRSRARNPARNRRRPGRAWLGRGRLAVRWGAATTPAPTSLRRPGGGGAGGGGGRGVAGGVGAAGGHLMVLDRPPGLRGRGGTGQQRHLVAMLAALRFGRDDDPRLVHRLDKDTSGLLVLARSGAAAVALARSFRSRAVGKIYFAAVAGRVEPARGTVRYGLVKAAGNFGGNGVGEKMQLVHPDEIKATAGARHATTDYRVIEQAGGRAAWVAMRPVTGRTHQLRAHMAALGCPIAGDGKYGGRGQENVGTGRGARLGGAPRPQPHLPAARLTSPHPAPAPAAYLVAPPPPHRARPGARLPRRHGARRACALAVCFCLLRSRRPCDSLCLAA